MIDGQLISALFAESKFWLREETSDILYLRLFQLRNISATANMTREFPHPKLSRSRNYTITISTHNFFAI